MPDGKMWVNEIKEILGERCCKPSSMTRKKRKCGPESTYLQEYLVRGTFLVEDDDESDADDEPEPNTYWVHIGRGPQECAQSTL